MKYRRLTQEELTHLEGDLKAFLIINGIEGEAWEKLNKETPDKAQQLVDLFSDNVLQTVYEKVNFLEFRRPDSCIVFQMGKTEQALIAINKKPTCQVDLSTVESIHAALTNHINELDFFHSKKAYTQDRELEIHTLIEQGCVLSVQEFWDSLNEVIGNKEGVS
jgi:hypothetical protein